jgi:arylsulfatase A-like enzyme
MVGKYLNSWAPDFGDDPPRPEFDFWVAHGGLAAVRDTFYFAPTLNVEGEWIEHEGYATHVVRDYALEFLDEASQLQAPFLLIFAPFAPHKPADPAPGDENLYQDLPAFRPPSFNEAVISDKPAWLVEKARRTPEEIESIDQFRRRQLQSLNAVDEAVESLLLELERQGNLDKTVVIFVSDNGEFWGEHRLESKEWLYEEAVRVPFALRYPPLVEGQRVENRLVANIDIAPTVYELAGLPIPENLDGRSLVPLLEGTDEWREELILETWANDGTYFQAIHTGRYVYVSEEGNPSEFFDLRDDPFQLENVLGSPDYAYIEVELKMRLDAAGGLVEGQAADE